MKRCIYHVPRRYVAIVSVVARTEAAAHAKLLKGDGFEEGQMQGSLVSGKPKLITCMDVAPSRRRKRREQ